MAEEQLFRSAIGGFNKEDVIEYIDGINRAAAENQDWFDRQSKAMAETIKRLTQENNSLKSAATSNAQEVSRLQEELRRLQDEAQAGGHSDQEVADLKRQLAEQSEALEESERRFNAVIERGDGDAVLAEKYRALEADHKSLQSAYAELKAQSPAADLSKQEQMANALLRMRDELARRYRQGDRAGAAVAVAARPHGRGGGRGRAPQSRARFGQGGIGTAGAHDPGRV